MKRIIAKLIFPITGLVALTWFLIRVIPKPSRATYPCMRAAAPIASSFVIYLLGLASSFFFFKKAKKYLNESRTVLFSIFLLLGLLFSFSTFLQTDQKVYAKYQAALEGPNQPMGNGIGIYPGRVVWIYDPDATDQSCKNSQGDYWWQDDNTDQQVVNSMVSKAIKMMTGKATDAEAWDAIFRNYNKSHGRGDVGYTAGEKIVIKLNLNTGSSGNYYTRSDYKTVDTSPQIVEAILDQLINIAGVAQADIGFGDPGRTVDNIFWDKFHSKFPNVKYWGEGNGRTSIVQSSSPKFMNSDGEQNNFLPTCYLEASYMINIPVLKQHHRAGVSLTSKNHFGTFVPFLGNAFPLHYSLPCTEGDGNVNNGEYNQYRIFVDFIGHKDLGGKTILFLIDGLWSSTNYGDPPWKWRMTPFNNDWPSSIIASQDPVAVESVGFDFLYTEFEVGNPSHNAFPHYSAVDDFLHQAADSTNWPNGLKYDPEGDGTPLPGSMGVHEHWNNAIDKKYSRNLGQDKGIELLSNYSPTPVEDSKGLGLKENDFILKQNYPNPFNPSTVISYQLPVNSAIKLKLYDINGNEVATLIDEEKPSGSYNYQFSIVNNQLPSGIYFYKLVTGNFSDSKKMILIK
jgi:hypothetical protein